MASPVVAGAAALLLQARPELTPDEVKALLTQTAAATADRQATLDIPAALHAQPGAANGGLTPNTVVRDALVAAGIDPTRATWTRATWTRATWTAGASGTNAPWARATWTCVECESAGNGVDATRSTWSRSTWSRSTWSSVEW
jgi:serine protease AprX